MDNGMIERIFKNWKTSVTGAGIILISLVLVYFDKASLTEAGAFIVLAIGLLYSKDPK